MAETKTKADQSLRFPKALGQMFDPTLDLIVLFIEVISESLDYFGVDICSPYQDSYREFLSPLTRQFHDWFTPRID